MVKFNMYALKSSVGERRTNFGGDVAFIQFAMKVIKDKKGTP